MLIVEHTHCCPLLRGSLLTDVMICHALSPWNIEPRGSYSLSVLAHCPIIQVRQEVGKKDRIHHDMWVEWKVLEQVTNGTDNTSCHPNCRQNILMLPEELVVLLCGMDPVLDGFILLLLKWSPRESRAVLIRFDFSAYSRGGASVKAKRVSRWPLGILQDSNSEVVSDLHCQMRRDKHGEA